MKNALAADLELFTLMTYINKGDMEKSLSKCDHFITLSLASGRIFL